MRAVLSVWDKTGLAGFAAGLAALGWELYSTGNTERALVEAGVPVTSVAELTQFPEILDGRVKTLHPRLHGGILARRDLPAHMAELEQQGIGPIDLVVSNLYPFVDALAAQSRTKSPFGALQGAANDGPLPPGVQEAVEQIDIGGPTLVRASAKNFQHVIIVTNPADYAPVLNALRSGGVSRELRARLAQKAYEHTAQYDAYVSQYFAAVNGQQFAQNVSLPLTQSLALSYGENPHQQAAFYRLGDPRLAGPSLADLEQLHGDALSYNNLLDLDSAYAIVAEFDQPAVAIVKHNSPCGVGIGETITEAYKNAYQGDPLSAHGGVVAANRTVGGPMVEAMAGVLYWVLVAPDYTEKAQTTFERRKRQTRVFRLPVPPRNPGHGALPGFGLHYRPVMGGFLAQTHDAVPPEDLQFKQVSQRAPTPQELADLHFAWRVVKHVRSNAAVFARQGAVVGVGAGQQSRVDSVVAAARVARRSTAARHEQADAGVASTSAVAGHESDAGTSAEGNQTPAAGSVMATDGFFAFPDAVEEAARAGATAVAHPGGGNNDHQAVEMADRYGLALVVTGYRHFRH